MTTVLQALGPHVTPNHLVISIAAGVTLDTLQRALGKDSRVVRVLRSPSGRRSLAGCAASRPGRMLTELEPRARSRALPPQIRVMPNTPCLIQRGASAYALGANATPRDADVVRCLLSAVGFCIQCEEKQMDAVTGARAACTPCLVC